MAKTKRSTKEEKAGKASTRDETTNQSSNLKVVIITTLITALVGLIGTLITVYIQDIYRPRLGVQLTQTAGGSVAQDICPPAAARQSPTEVAILTQYVHVERADVYSEKDQSLQPFQTLQRGAPVEVLDNADRLWACITYTRDDVRIYGYVLRDQLIFDFALTGTAVVDATAAPDVQAATAVP